MVLAVVDDLIFFSKNRQTAQRLIVAVEGVDPNRLEHRIAQGGVVAVILDLNHGSGSAVEVLRTLKGNPETAPLPVLGFVSHVETDRAAAARAAGCDQVLARSTFSAQLPQILQKLAGKAADP